MQPTPTNILRGVLENLEALVFPHIQDPHAKSVAKVTRILISHVILRFDQEIPMLLMDSAEKRALLARLAEDIAKLPSEQAGDLPAIAGILKAAAEQPVPCGVAATLESITADNDRLKDAVETVIYALYESRSKLTEATFARLDGAIRQQLRVQTEGELALVAPAYGNDPFPF